MKLTNPYGRTINQNTDTSNPRGCFCSSGSQNTSYNGLCIVCSCQCDHGPTNKSYNADAGFAKNYG